MIDRVKVDESLLATRAKTRTASDIHDLMKEVQSDPGVWFVLTRHANMAAAAKHAYAFRTGRRGNTVRLYLPNVQFIAINDPEHGAVVCVRWVPVDTPS